MTSTTTMSTMKNSPVTLRHIKSLLRESADTSPERSRVFFKTDAGSYAEYDQFMGKIGFWRNTMSSKQSTVDYILERNCSTMAPSIKILV